MQMNSFPSIYKITWLSFDDDIYPTQYQILCDREFEPVVLLQKKEGKTYNLTTYKKDSKGNLIGEQTCWDTTVDVSKYFKLDSYRSVWFFPVSCREAVAQQKLCELTASHDKILKYF